MVYQTENVQTKVPDSCKLFVVRSLVPKDLEEGLNEGSSHRELQKATKQKILEQASLERDAHFDDKGKQDKPVPMEVDALLSKVSTTR